MGKEHLNDNGWYQYECDCGFDTEYGIFRYKTDDKWSINSCCGGCVSAADIVYCPYCSKKVQVKK